MLKIIIEKQTLERAQVFVEDGEYLDVQLTSKTDANVD
jgi:hypothetical protein